MQEGARVGPYVLGPLLAEGGMARVHVATSAESGARVALKLPIVPPGGLPDDVLDQVRHEVQAMARLSHAHIVPVLDWGSAPDGQLYLAMPLLEDRTLREIAGHLDAGGLLGLIAQLLDALAYAHDRGVIHRDVKARNLLVTHDGGAPHLWLTDFGIASLDTGGGLGHLHGPLGTPTYMAPEQLRGDVEVGPQADLYAVGVLLYLLFEGRRPFAGSSLEEIIDSRTRAPQPRFTEDARCPIPSGLDAIVERLLEGDPLDRYPSASALQKALAALTPSSSAPRAAAACLECGEPLAAGVAFCPVCETGAPTIADGEPTSASHATHRPRPITALAVRTGEARAADVLALLERAGAHVRWAEDGLAVAALGLTSEPGIAQAAELALSIGAMGARVGLAPGTARVSSGSVLELDATDAVALADRAEAGGVRAPSTLEHALATSHEVEIDAGALRVRGTALPSARAAMSDARLAPLLGAARAVERERVARGVTLVGGEGVGKSLALTELADRLEAAGWTCWTATASPGAQIDPLGVVRAAIRGWAGVWPGAGRAAIARELASRVDDRELTGRVAAVLVEQDALEPGVRARALDALGGLIAALAERDRILIAIDDLGATDAMSRELCSLSLERLASLPLLVVATAKPDRPTLDGTLTVPMPDLTDEDARTLLAGAPLDDADRSRLLRLAAGHPGRLLELARLYRSAPGQGSTSADAMAGARIDDLSPEAREVVQLAAIAGPRFWLAQLFAMADGALQASLSQRVIELARDGVFSTIELSSIAGTRELELASEAVREVARRTVAGERARALHERAARWLERNAGHLGGALLEKIATHWEAAGDLPRAAAWETRAGRRAESLGAMSDALDRYRSALAKLDREGPVQSSLGRDGAPLPVDVPGLVSAICRVAVTSGELEIARSAAERVLAMEEPPRALVRGQARAALAEIARMAGQPEHALSLIDAALGELGAAGDRILRAQLLGRRGWILGYVLGRNDEGRADSEEALRLLDGLDVPAIESHIYSELGANELRAGRWDRQLECNRRALALAEQAGELPGQVRAHINLSVCYTNRGQLADAAEHAVRAAAMALRAGLHRARIVAMNNLGIVRLDQGELDEAARLLTLVIELCERHGIRDILHETLPTLGRVLLARGDREGALSRIAQAQELSEREANPVGVALAERVRALVRLRAGDREEADRCLDRAEAALGVDGDAYERAITRLARALLSASDTSAIERELRALGADPQLEIRRWS